MRAAGVVSHCKLISNTQLSMNIQQIYTTHDDLAWEHCTIQGWIKAHLANFDGDVWHIFDEPAQRFHRHIIENYAVFSVHHLQIVIFSFIAHLSLPWSIGWVALSFLFRLVGCSSRYGDTRPNLTSSCPTPPNPYIFWKLMIIAIQKWIRNTNTKTKTNTKTMTKTKTPRE